MKTIGSEELVTLRFRLKRKKIITLMFDIFIFLLICIVVLERSGIFVFSNAVYWVLYIVLAILISADTVIEYLIFKIEKTKSCFTAMSCFAATLIKATTAVICLLSSAHYLNLIIK